MWSGHKKSENQNIKIEACGGWSTKITHIKNCVQIFKVVQEELSKQQHFKDGPQNKLQLWHWQSHMKYTVSYVVY